MAPMAQPASPRFGAGDENHPQDAGTLRAECQADGHLLSAQCRGKSDDAVDTEQRQQNGGTGKRGDQRGVEAARRLAFGDHAIHRFDLRERKLRVEGTLLR